jgi:hypothetical protein
MMDRPTNPRTSFATTAIAFGNLYTLRPDCLLTEARIHPLIAAEMRLASAGELPPSGRDGRNLPLDGQALCP